jgi:hypothetical protein
MQPLHKVRHANTPAHVRLSGERGSLAIITKHSDAKIIAEKKCKYDQIYSTRTTSQLIMKIALPTAVNDYS